MKKIVLAAAVSAALSPAAFAADPMTIVITASRHEQAQADVTTPITVITKEDIQQQQPKSVLEALATTGIQVKSSGGYGQDSSILLRGIGQDRMLVLVDGIQIGSATLGEAKLQHIPMEQVERIEIVRGARSSLYGANAIGGVIQIFTKKPEQNQNYVEIEAGHGSYNSIQNSLSGGWSNASTQLSATASHFSAEGFDIKPEKSSNGVDNDGYRNETLTLNGQHKLGQQILSAGAQYSSGSNDYDDCSKPDKSKTNNCISKFENLTTHFGIEAKTSRTLNLTSQISHHQDSSQQVVAGVEGDEFVTNTSMLNLQAQYSPSTTNTIITGLDYKLDKISGSGVNDYFENERDNKALFALWHWNSSRISSAISARTDENQAFGQFNTYGVEIGAALTDELKITASHATAFTAPTFNDLYAPDETYTVGNPDVVPEESQTTSIGLRAALESRLNFELNLYKTKLDNMIKWAKSSPSSKWTPSNLDSVEITGIELLASAEFGNSQVSVNANALNAEDLKEKKQLTYTAKRTANFRLSHSIDKVTFGLDALYTGARYTDTDNTETLGGYTLFNADAKYQVDKELQLLATIKNLSDKEYVSNQGYATAGRTIFSSIRYRF